MAELFDSRDKAEKYTAAKDDTLKSIAEKHSGKDKVYPVLDWQSLALYNWGTKEPREVNRALAETLGCHEINDNPSQSKLDPARGPEGAEKVVLIPKVWKQDNLNLRKRHVIKVKPMPRPVPAISITKLTRWFIPKDESCEIQYGLEGVSARADKVDFEVHTKNYYALQKKEDGTEIWNTRALCNTQAEENTTHVHQARTIFKLTDSKATGAKQTAPSWNGACKVTQGALAPDKTINFGCAPYIGLVRFYRDDNDKDAKIVLENFHPHWKQPPAPTTDGDTDIPEREIEPKSLMVKWDILGDNGKLKVGQIQVWDRDDKIVYCKAFNEQTIQSDKKLDLADCWGADKFERDKMPYRIQIQAHSDAQEENGLALAVMHTCVKSRVYTKAKMIGYDISPPAPYDGHADDETDINTRCKIMKEAITEAYKNVTGTDDSELKVFMAPEFFFRGTKGGYKMTKDDPDQSDWSLTSTIMKSLREETDKFEYADWLFTFGTVIGYEPYSVGTTETTFGGFQPVKTVRILDTGGGDQHRLVRIKIDNAKEFHNSIKTGQIELHIKQDALEDTIIDSTYEDTDKCWLKLRGKDTAFAENKDCDLLEPRVRILEINGPKIKVKSTICEKIPFTVGEVFWFVEQNSHKKTIQKCDKESDGIYTLTLDDSTGLAKGKAALIEPPSATEIFNIALVKKGWPAYLCELKEIEEEFSVGDVGDKIKIKQRVIDKNDKAEYLDEGLIYKEHVSSIDYTEVDFSKRQIEIDGETTTVIPTYGSTDKLSVNPNRTGSEINKSGIGGGTVFTIDGVTFGLEVCLDHAYNRLCEFYNGSNVKNGDPRVQIQLIPSWGMSIEGGDIACLEDGLLFNVDGRPLGAGGGSVLYENKPDYTCSIHTDVVLTSFRNGKCGLKHFRCADCNITKPSDNFTCGHTIYDMGYCENCGDFTFEDPSNLGDCYGCSNELKFCEKVLKLENPSTVHSTQHDVTSALTNCFHNIGTNNRIILFDSKDIPKPRSVKK